VALQRGTVCDTLYASHQPQLRAMPRRIDMKFLLNACAAAVTAGALLGTVSLAFAQNSPGVPGGILQDEFRLQEHPQLPFAASAPSKKYQKDTPSARRRKGDNGDPNGCNLQCPEDE
jgi:hypothetical protein